ncbi:hypothetical protein B0A78_03115 [Flavobacterium columnare NBRC 100251 = ATCC 23463]|uniref:Uncharacterized protein n=1 Tax=Flavobacterium columnare (strain ATCC 49512 / CIP 103533 / TG 44/87) TaxID=1041826 RepID=G8X825_FLACA|nr:hypothetical protein [Flavobacterium columnare]AEW87139.1 hypothetical protein FCOL_11690 [Flavobacterium columnare ATCC 49512]ANO47545.1 hypothetical protein Pf1_02090 [Flavobacterium columnare]APT21822.1 hypothetical protein BU993_03730 [Flavobacterium columnare]MBF6651364.1 hypothetical protein [Flavobacterium columnare]MBF6655016.1 hypothetical protein [Flavobacterium columnare]
MSSVISKNLQNYLKTIETESKEVLIDGYFHVDYVIDAFKKGEENGGQKALEDLKNKFTRASTQMFLYGIDLIRRLEEAGFSSEDFYVNPFAFKFLVVTNLQNTFNEDFIETFFKISFELQNKFKEEFGINAQYFFVQSDNLNASELKVDGFLKVSNE